MKTNHILKSVSALVLGSLIAGCGMTESTSHHNSNDPVLNATRIDFDCEQQVRNRSLAAEQVTNEGAFLAIANHAERCIEGIKFFPDHPDNKTAMQFNALRVLNLIKAGELVQARESLNSFRQRFPRQDLVMDDFSSFVDTAHALLASHQLSKRELSLLNINSTLRSELARHQYWLSN